MTLLPPAAAAVAAPVAQPAALPVASPAPLESLHPALWRAHQLGRSREGTSATGFAELDAELPGGGWPHRTLTELLLPHPGVGEIRLLAPALAALAAGQRSVMLFEPPAQLNAWALVQLRVDAQQLIVVHGRPGPREQALRRDGRSSPSATGHAGALRPALQRTRLPPAADVLWALEHALRSGHVGAALAWPGEPLRADALRRLQLAAQSHDGPAFLLRPLAARAQPSAAPLRLVLHPVGPDLLSLQIVKRRGPALAQPLKLWLPAVLPPAAKAAIRQAPVAAGEPPAMVATAPART